MNTNSSPFDVFFRLLFRVTLKNETLVEDEGVVVKGSRKRIVEGLLLGCDHQTNLLLDNSQELVEETVDGVVSVIKSRQLGMLSIPGKYIERIEVEQEKYERALRWA